VLFAVLSQLKVYIKNRPLIYRPLSRVWRLRHWRAERREWALRNREVCGCPDNEHIPRVADAGKIVGKVQVMHNGIRVGVGSYYGSTVTKMLELNRGVHEPQEERAFQEVLKHVRPDGVMMELGAYWGFYSMWFLTGHPRRSAVLVEPEAANLERGRDNFSLAGLRGSFVKAFVGDKAGVDAHGQRTMCVDELMEEFKIPRLDILHADIQGFETAMLRGARRSLERRAIDYVFISTHGQDKHDECRRVLTEFGFEIIADAGIADTYSHDGLIVARRGDLKGLGPVAIALKSRDGVRG
jgi:hypothetical protein